jgi:plasmid maintenance system antidote protein VapI
MEKSGLDTQPKLAAKSHVSQSHISRLLDQESGVSIDVVERLAAAFDCQPWELLVDNDAMRDEVVRRFVR